jgi:hypothetical protein
LSTLPLSLGRSGWPAEPRTAPKRAWSGSRAVAIDHAKDGPLRRRLSGTVETEWISKIIANARPDGRSSSNGGPPTRRAPRIARGDRAAIAFVAGPDGRFINGSALIIDGGLTAA